MLTLKEYKALVNEELGRQYDRHKDSATAIDPFYGTLLKEMREYILRGGKRMRPYLLYLSYCGWGGQDEEALLPVSAALEMVHNFLLIHDDIIDQDLIRYNGPTIEGVYRQRFAAEKDADSSERYAKDIALLAGDIVHTLSISSLIGSSFSAELKISALEEVCKGTVAVAGGQLIDVILPLGLSGVSLSRERIVRVYTYKTACYSFMLPMVLGRLLAGGTDIKNILEEFATPLGIGFQIGDDLLGIFGLQETTGKPNDSDIKERKQTFLYQLALELLPTTARARLDFLYGNHRITEGESDELRSLFTEYGVKKAAEELRNQYFSEALRRVGGLGLSEESAEGLEQVIAMLKSRQS